MAKYKITYKCGHTAEVQLYGKEAEREKKIKWYATIDCPECEAREQKEKAEAKGLPHLTGSEKQIIWATKLRNNALDKLDAQISIISNEQNKSKMTAFRNQWISKETASTYWIDNRDELENLRDIAKLIETSVNFIMKDWESFRNILVAADEKIDHYGPFAGCMEEPYSSSLRQETEDALADDIEMNLLHYINNGILTQDIVDRYRDFFERHGLPTDLKAFRDQRIEEIALRGCNKIY